MTTDTATVRTVEYGEASRLPDTSWMWRRLLIFMICGGILVGMGYVLWEQPKLDSSTNLFVRNGYYTLWLGLTLYGVGATVTDITRLFAAMRTTRKETISSGPPPATVTEGRVETVDPSVDPANYGGPRP